MASVQRQFRHVLDGYKVLDFTQFVAGPTVTRLMATMGAEVIKVELAPDGDRARLIPYVRENRSGYYVQHNLGKMSLCIDARHPEGATILRELVKKVDVLVENFAPGTIARLGFGYSEVSKLNPPIVMCSVSTFGQTGPLATDPGFDPIAQAYAGITGLIGEKDGPPVIPPMAIGDVSTGVHGMGAIACALLYRERTGIGQYIDVSLLDSYFGYHDMGVEMYTASGGANRVERSGRHYPGLSPCGVFRGKKIYFIIIAWMDRHWAQFCEAIGHPELARDARFVDLPTRVKNRDALVKVIEAWLASMPDDEKSLEVMRAARIPVAPIRTLEEAMNHPHLRKRGTVAKVHDRVLGDLEVPGFPIRFSEFPAPADIQAPLLGEHNEYVLKKYLGYSDAQIAALNKTQVLLSKPY
jgi:crotonobetainyl-CoA:carnitine CoA-transferase CaiB-like acyl-CoA transferase